MTLQEIKEQVNLVEYARQYHGLECNRDGKARCPFHKPDKNPSFIINFDGGIWKWFDHHDQQGGSIIDFEMRFSNCTKEEAITTLLSRYGKSAKPTEPEKPAATVTGIIPYIYKDAAGNEILKKEKRLLSDGSKTYAWRHKEKNQWITGRGSYSLIPYNLDKFKDHKEVIVCEGEKDCNNLNSLGVFSTTAPAGAQSWPEGLSQYFRDFDIITFLYDVGVEKAVKSHASILKKKYPDKNIFIASVPMEAPGSDITDYLTEREDKKKALLDVLQTAEELIKPVEETEEYAHIISLNKIKPKSIDWLWPNRFPSGKISVLVGDPGSGKSYLSLYIASLITTGRPWPDFGLAKKGTVILLTAEDGLADTVRTRADEMKADVSKIKILEGIKFSTETDDTKLFKIPTHVQLLKKIIRQFGDVALVVFDPVTTYFEKTDLYKIDSVMGSLAPLSQLAEQEGFAVLLILHFNKDEARKAIYRTMGSMAFMTGPRYVWALSRDDNNLDRRLLTPLKTNLSINPSSLAFYIEENKGIVFEPEPVDITAEQALRKKEEKEEPGAMEQALEFLTQLFKDENHVPATEVYKHAEENDIKLSTLKEAKKKIGIKSKKMGLAENRQWEWYK